VGSAFREAVVNIENVLRSLLTDSQMAPVFATFSRPIDLNHTDVNIIYIIGRPAVMGKAARLPA